MSVSEGLPKPIFRSCGGDSVKHSPRDIDIDEDKLLLAVPNLNVGSWFSGGFVFIDMEFAERPLLRTRDGLRNEGFLRLDFLRSALIAPFARDEHSL
jgi:hypothetical protein